MYIHRFKQKLLFGVHRDKLDSIENPTTISEKLKYYRIKNGYLQKQVAKIIGVNRGTYIRFENNGLDRYPLEEIKKLSELYGADISDLLDEYNLFVYNNQGKKIKEIRKSLNVTQEELAMLMGAGLGAVKEWEKNRNYIKKKSYLKLMDLVSDYEKKNNSSL